MAFFAYQRLSLLVVIFLCTLQAALFSTAVAQQQGATGTCNSTVTLTRTDALGPFYEPDSPETSVIASEGDLLDPTNLFTVRGQVFGYKNCRPLVEAIVEAWYAGDEVFYQPNQYRGQLSTDACGRFEFEQTFPAVYPSRPIPHIHYRISDRSDNLLLVTQLYFEGAIPLGYFPDPSQIVSVVNEPDGSRSAIFNIYVDALGTGDTDICSSAELSESLGTQKRSLSIICLLRVAFSCIAFCTDFYDDFFCIFYFINGFFFSNPCYSHPSNF
jgi:protocatechuate 3,4-dioxygenase beta subunit